jgi:hypothetical protein
MSDAERQLKALNRQLDAEPYLRSYNPEAMALKAKCEARILVGMCTNICNYM